MEMGYRVVYGAGKIDGDTSWIRTGRTIWMSVGIAFLFLYVVSRSWPAGNQVLQRLASFQGLKQIHGHLDTLVMELQCGTSLGRAVTAFCRDVVQMGMTYAS